MRLFLTLLVVFMSQPLLAQEPNPAAVRIFHEGPGQRWCGTGTILAEDFIGTNKHVSGNEGARLTVKVKLPNGQDREYRATLFMGAYNTRTNTDWAIIRVPGIASATGIEPIKWFRTRPNAPVYQFTGSPACVWPLRTFRATIARYVGNVALWLERTIGGQSGSTVWVTMPDGKRVGHILLTWLWTEGRRQYGAGQITSSIYGQMIAQNTDGPKQLPGLIEMTPFQDRDIKEGFYESPEAREMLGAARALGIRDLDIWYKPGGGEPDPPPTDDDLTDAEREAAEKIKGMGFDLEALEQQLRGIRMDATSGGGDGAKATAPSEGTSPRAGLYPKPTIDWSDLTQIVMGHQKIIQGDLATATKLRDTLRWMNEQIPSMDLIKAVSMVDSGIERTIGNRVGFALLKNDISKFIYRQNLDSTLEYAKAIDAVVEGLSEAASEAGDSAATAPPPLLAGPLNSVTVNRPSKVLRPWEPLAQPPWQVGQQDYGTTNVLHVLKQECQINGPCVYRWEPVK